MMCISLSRILNPCFAISALLSQTKSTIQGTRVDEKIDDFSQTKPKLAIDFVPRYKRCIALVRRRNTRMATSKRLPVFEKFIQDARSSWAELPNTEARMKEVKLLLEKLVNEPTLREHAKTWPCTEGHKNLLLYED